MASASPITLNSGVSLLALLGLAYYAGIVTHRIDMLEAHGNTIGQVLALTEEINKKVEACK